jgi:uncharacterized membrane protein YkvA (DUF1232 family)
MTVRRWMKKSPGEEIPMIYRRAIEDAVCGMITEGILDPSSGIARQIMKAQNQTSFQAVIKSLGLPKDFYTVKNKTNSEQILTGLSRIGSDGVKCTEVKDSIAKIRKYGKLGEEWPKRIAVLLKVILSKTINEVDKLVAFGALFYLIFPFDLIPDYIPVVGLLDDYAILGLAAIYYIKRFSYLKN